MDLAYIKIFKPGAIFEKPQHPNGVIETPFLDEFFRLYSAEAKAKAKANADPKTEPTNKPPVPDNSKAQQTPSLNFQTQVPNKLFGPDGILSQAPRPPPEYKIRFLNQIRGMENLKDLNTKIEPASKINQEPKENKPPENTQPVASSLQTKIEDQSASPELKMEDQSPKITSTPEKMTRDLQTQIKDQSIIPEKKIPSHEKPKLMNVAEDQASFLCQNQEKIKVLSKRERNISNDYATFSKCVNSLRKEKEAREKSLLRKYTLEKGGQKKKHILRMKRGPALKPKKVGRKSKKIVSEEQNKERECEGEQLYEEKQKEQDGAGYWDRAPKRQKPKRNANGKRTPKEMEEEEVEPLGGIPSKKKKTELESFDNIEARIIPIKLTFRFKL